MTRAHNQIKSNYSAINFNDWLFQKLSQHLIQRQKHSYEVLDSAQKITFLKKKKHLYKAL